MPPTTVARPFRLLDAMFLVATLAVAFGLVNEGRRKARASGYDGYLLSVPVPEWLARPAPQLLDPGRRFVWVPLGEEPTGNLSAQLMGLWTLGGPCLLMISLAVVVLPALPPRVAWRDLIRSPGWLASLAGSTLIAVTIAPCAAFAWRTGSELWVLDLFELAVVLGPLLAGLGVVLGWLGLVVSRRARFLPVWLEAIGLLCGIGHIASAVLVGWFLYLRI
jgi:hypothetical protein